MIWWRKVLIAFFSDGVTWDFGQLEFRNVTIVGTPFRVDALPFMVFLWLTFRQTATGKDSSWCTKQPTNYNSASIYSVTGAEASTDSNGVTCTIQSVVLERPS